MLMIDPFTMPYLVDFLKDYGVILRNNIIMSKDPYSLGIKQFVSLAHSYYQKHPITRGFNFSTIFPFARSVELGRFYPKGAIATTLVRADAVCWTKNNHTILNNFQEGPDRQRPVPIAVLVEALPIKSFLKTENDNWAICVFGDSQFANNHYFKLLGNKKLLMHTISWMINEHEAFPKAFQRPLKIPPSSFSLSKKQGAAIFWCFSIIEPIFIIMIGCFLMFIRGR